MKKVIIWSIVSLIVIGVAVDGFLWLRKPQVIVLPDGTKLTLVGVTYGRHHVAPKITIAGRVHRGGARLDSTNDTLVVWLEAQHKPNRYSSCDLLVYDKADTACVSAATRIQSQILNGVDIMGFRLDAYPRWDRKMILRVMTWDNRGQRVSKERFVAANPAVRGPFPRWTPEPLPDTQSDGDLDVTLTRLVAGAQSPYNNGVGVTRNDPINRGILLDFDVQQKGQSVTNWSPVQVVTSDAAGNSIQGWINPFWQNGRASGYFYQQVLWPTEPAWKLRVEFSRTSGFKDDELWSVSGVPVQPGTRQDMQNAWNGLWNRSAKSTPAFAEATVNGIHLKLFPAIQFKDQNQGGEQTVSFIIKADPDPQAQEMRLTLLKVFDEEGRVLQNRGSSWGGGNYQFQFAGPRNLGVLNINLALHKSRFVEFTVKPSKP